MMQPMEKVKLGETMKNEFNQMFYDGIEVFRFTDWDILKRFFNAPGAQMWLVSGMGVKPEYLTEEEYYQFHASYFLQAVQVFQFDEFI